MKPNDQDLFKPLSAKIGRKQYSSGGNEMTASRIRMSEARSIAWGIGRRKVAASLSKPGTKT